jgi:hypothetical protein
LAKEVSRKVTEEMMQLEERRSERESKSKESKRTYLSAMAVDALHRSLPKHKHNHKYGIP